MQRPLVQANQWKANLQNKIGSSTDRPLLDFISQPAYLQDVALGTKKLRLETGDEIVILLQLYVLLFHHGLFVGTRSAAKHRDSSEQVKEHSFVS